MLQNLLQKNNNKEYLIIRGITSKSFDNNRAKILNEEQLYITTHKGYLFLNTLTQK
jgi:hypothetical protein